MRAVLMLAWSWAYLPATVEERGADFLHIAAWIGAAAALSTIYHRSPVRKGIQWVWRRNVSQPVATWATKAIVAAAEPLIESTAAVTRAASLAQHDEQNAKLIELSTDVRTGFARGSQRMDEMTARIGKLETRNEAVRRTDNAADTIIDAVHDAAIPQGDQ